MVYETDSELRAATVHAVWPPDDTEESVMGTDLHQMTIMNVRWGVNEIAAALTPAGGPAPWQALSQTIITGFERPDLSRFKTLPDVFVYHQAIGRRRGSVAVHVDGPPVLIIEVLSEATYEVDLDLVSGKGFSYARAGVREYLVLDPTGEFLPNRGKAWRLEEGLYRPWLQDTAGRWQSQEIAAAFGMDGELAAVYSSDGQRQLREGEISRELAELRRQVEQLKQQR